MANLSNINGKFAVDSTGAIKFNNLTGTNNQVLIANTGASPTWVDVSTIIGGPYLPLTGGTLAGAGNLVVGGTLTVNGATTLNAALTGTSATFVRDASGYALRLDSGDATTDNDLRFAKGGTDYAAIQIDATTASNFQFYVNDGTNWINTLTFARADGQATFTKLVSGIAPTADLNFATKKYVDDGRPDPGVTQITAGTNVTITPVGGTGNVTINANTQGDITALTLGNGLTGTSLTGPIPDVLMSGSYTGKFTIDSTGDVEYLALNTTATTNKRVRIQFTQNDNAGMEIGTDYSVNNGNDFYFYDRVAGSTMLFTSVASSYFPGKLAVGMTSTPNAQLHVSANGSAAHGSSTGIDVAAGAGGGNVIALDADDNHNWLPYTDGDNYYSANNHYFRSGTGNSPYYMTINTSGNVGIGLGSGFASQKLHVQGSNHFVTFENTSTTANHYSQMLLKAGTALGYIWTANQNSTNWGGPNSLNIYTGEAGAIAFFTTGIKRMTIQAAGNVNIQNKPNSGLAYDILINVGTSPDGVIGYQTQDQLASLLAVNANSNWIKTGTHIHNSNTGNVGVGTGSTAPSNRLTVNQGGGVRVTGIANGSYIELSGNLPGYAVDQYPVIKSDGTIHFANNGKYSAYIEGSDTYFGMLNSSTQTKVQLHTNGNTYFLGGSIGIGTTTPVVTAWGSTDTRQLTIVGSNYGVITLQGSATALTKYSLGVGGTKFYMAYDNVAGIHRMTMDSTGNLGIGTTTPDYQLDVENSSHAVVRIHAGVNSSASLRLKNDAQDWDLNTQTNDTFAIYNQTSATQPFSILPNGNVGIGVTGPQAKLDIGDGDFKQLKIIGANRLCVFRFQNAQSSFNNPDIVLFSNTTATGSYPQVSVHIKMHGRGFSANYSQFTEALATVELSTALIGLRSSIINHTTLGSAVSAGTFSISGTSLRFTPNRQTNYDTFSIEVNINSISVTYNT